MSEPTGHIDPTRDQLRAFRDLPAEGPVQMLNLVRVREQAAYAPGHAQAGAAVSGHDAYRAYARTSAVVFARVGGRQVWVGRFEQTVIGAADERWDFVFIAEYPSRDAFLTMLRDPEYQAAVQHRQAAVADSRLIRLTPRMPGQGFGE